MRILPIALLTVALLSGCLPTEPPANTAAPQPTSTPLFASEEEALAAAVEAYGAYLEMSDLIASEGGVNPERIAPFVTEDWLEKEVEVFDELAASGNRLVGHSEIVSTTLQQTNSSGSGETNISIYACVDFSNTRVMNDTGSDITPATRNPLVSLELGFQATSRNSVRLFQSEPWPGDSFC